MSISFDDLNRSPVSGVIVAKPAAVTRPPRPGFYRRIGKRALDVAAILAAAPVVVPVVGLLALAVALDGGKPFYCQARVGRHGRPFRIWKLRSMVHDADARMQTHLAADPAARAEWARCQKLRHDPRVTRFGQILRRSSLDELPQLWNVLRGDMSLVGPRPMLPDQRQMYPGTAYYALRPGITGYWQITERNRTSFAARAEYDTAYEADLTVGTDLDVLLRTFAVVLRGTGC